MKKYLLGFFALSLAIFLSSFTHVKDSQAKATGLYWYPVSAGVTSDDTPVTQGSKEEAKTFDCPDSMSQPICLYGSEDDNLPLNTTVPTGNSSVIIRERD